jgi:hypothetical protein
LATAGFASTGFVSTGLISTGFASADFSSAFSLATGFSAVAGSAGLAAAADSDFFAAGFRGLRARVGLASSEPDSAARSASVLTLGGPSIDAVAAPEVAATAGAAGSFAASVVSAF